ncbi:hypothetical protein TrVE_jg2720 [Triparma verrucosa]|uniref:Alanine--glyoxylate transaminase n=1 Tax=Triparma verrucosa TaxID=1606542 RepID=A0A9W7FLG8_9STRA|nr:hypothetical protein TrVE_jg2720 [Triparma verrucosa]
MLSKVSRLAPRLRSGRSLSAVSGPYYPELDHGPYSEFSVVYTDRALNHMAPPFVNTMQSISKTLKDTYNADKTVLIPGSGTYSMEATARQFVTPGSNKPVVVRNGWFSFRWTEIFEGMGISESDHHILKAKSQEPGVTECHYAPHDVDKVVKTILEEKPPAVFMPHVETSTGMMVTDEYIMKLSAAAKEVGAVMVLDCIASGTCWVDMKKLGLDVVITAPQKGWSGPAAVGIAMLSDNAYDKMMNGPESSSFCVNLKKWSGMMQLYEGGGFGYHTTMPTDAIRTFDEIANEQKKIGLDVLNDSQYKMGAMAREMLESKGLKSVAASENAAPGVLVYYSPAGNSNPEMVQKFHSHNMQIAMGVPWRIDEPDVNTFRIGLFGIDKLNDPVGTVAKLEYGIDAVMGNPQTTKAAAAS